MKENFESLVGNLKVTSPEAFEQLLLCGQLCTRYGIRVDNICNLIAEKKGIRVDDVLDSAKGMQGKIERESKTWDLIFNSNSQTKFNGSGGSTRPAKANKSERSRESLTKKFQCENPANVVSYRPKKCVKCLQPLKDAIDDEITQVHEIAEINYTHHCEVTCTCNHCGTKNAGEFPPGLTKVHNGPNLTTAVACAYMLDGKSFAKIQESIENQFNHRVSVGALVNLMKRIGKRAEKSQRTNLDFLSESNQIVSVTESNINIKGERATGITFWTNNTVTKFVHKHGSSVFLKNLDQQKIPTVMIAGISSLLASKPVHGQVCLNYLLEYVTKIWQYQNEQIGARLIDLVKEIIMFEQELKTQSKTYIKEKQLQLTDQLYNIVFDCKHTKGQTITEILKLLEVFNTGYLFKFVEFPELKIHPYAIDEKLETTKLGYQYRARTVFRTLWSAVGVEAITGCILTGIMSGLTPFESIKKLVFESWRGTQTKLALVDNEIKE